MQWRKLYVAPSSPEYDTHITTNESPIDDNLVSFCERTWLQTQIESMASGNWGFIHNKLLKSTYDIKPHQLYHGNGF